ncbi:MAG: molybdopterin molybdenumtransferase MoeA [Candidatus Solibacter sp.]|nr:molybdopterin molybdenumtransferase MoeA [Candidatus Solibacter sp.]
MVVERVLAGRRAPEVETVAPGDALGRVLACEIRADRDYPPFDRSVRDGFAVRAEDLPGPLRIVGEVRAGQVYPGEVGAGEAVETMTGAPVPKGADCVVMVEHTASEGGRVTVDRAYQAGDHISPRGAECRAGDVLMRAGVRVGYAGVALMASVGMREATVYRRPRVAIVATGDEIVADGVEPAAHQIRNSNSHSLAAQVRLAGGEPEILPVAPDELDATAALIERGLEADLLLLSGGVSAGRYDFVEQALEWVGAEFYFDRVLIQPGQPLVFGRARGKFFFGLPGNPASTMVCFEVFARAAVELIGGMGEAELDLAEAALAVDFRHRAGLTRFLPAVLSEGGITPVKWAGSGDIAAQARANCLMVADPERPEYRRGERISVLLRR